MHLLAPSMRPKTLPAMLARPAGRAAARMSMSAGLPTGRLGSRVLGLVARGGAAAAAPEAGALGFKIGLAVLLCAFNAMCWAAPLRFKRFTGSSQKLGVASTFSGGVFLALAFGHMVPEAAEAFGEGGAAAACRWTLGGYLLIWAVERLANGAEAPPTDLSASDAAAGAAVGAAPPAEAQTSGSAAMLLGALSVHSMLETMALAVARSKSAAALLAGSIALHQPAESLALVVALLRAGLRGPKLLRLLLLFTAMGPLGCVAGLGLHARFGKLFGGALDGALIALTAGTFVYVGATEVVPEEFEDGGASKAKVLALLLGVATILGLARVADLLEARAG